MIIEHVVFRLADAVDEATLVAADADWYAELAAGWHGFMRRTVARDGNTWLIETLWDSVDDAEQAAASLRPAAMAVAACIDPATKRVQRFEALPG